MFAIAQESAANRGQSQLPVLLCEIDQRQVVVGGGGIGPVLQGILEVGERFGVAPLPIAENSSIQSGNRQSWVIRKSAVVVVHRPAGKSQRCLGQAPVVV